MAEATRAIQCTAQFITLKQAAMNGGDAKIIEHHALDFPRISLANVGQWKTQAGTRIG